MTEPRTEAGKRLLDWLYLNGGAFRTEDRDHIEAAILAIEAEAAHPESAPATSQSPVDLRAVVEAARDVDALWDAEDGEMIRWEVEAGEALEDLRAALRAVPAEAEEAATLPPPNLSLMGTVRRGEPFRPADASGGGGGLDAALNLVAMTFTATYGAYNEADESPEYRRWSDVMGAIADARRLFTTPPAPTPASEEGLRAAARALAAPSPSQVSPDTGEAE